MKIDEEIRTGIRYLIELTYNSGYLSAQLEADPPAIDAPEREVLKQLIDARNRVKIQVFGLIDEYATRRVIK